MTCGGAMNSHSNIAESLEKRLKPFIEHHGRIRYIFWPDLSSSHYSNETISFMGDEKIVFAPKLANPPNVPQLRQIERFWSHLKAEVYADGFRAESVPQLIRRIQNKLKDFKKAYFLRLFANLRAKVRVANECGPIAVIENFNHT
jgi:hypothetical protein